MQYPSAAANLELVARNNVTHGLSEKAQGKQREDVRLMRSSVAIARTDYVDWTSLSNALDARTATAAEWKHAAFRAAAWSPSGVSDLGGCVLATLSTNFDVEIHEAVSLPVYGDWERTLSLSAHMFDDIFEGGLIDEPIELTEATQEERNRQTAAVMRCQGSSIAWSQSIDSVAQDYSSLAVGHREGSVSFWTRESRQSMTMLHQLDQPDANGITNLAWSPWQLVNDDTWQALLACSDYSGAIHIIKVQRFTDAARASASLEVTPLQSLPSLEKRNVTQLLWIYENEEYRLAYTVLGSLCIARFATKDLSKAATVTELELPNLEQKHWAHASPWQPCAGLQYDHMSSSLFACLAEGSMYSVHINSKAPTLDLEASQRVTNLYRALYCATFKQADAKSKRRVVMKDLMQQGSFVYGFAQFGFSCQNAWVYENVRPKEQYHQADGVMVVNTIVNLIDQDALEASNLRKLVDEYLGADVPICHGFQAAELSCLVTGIAGHADDVEFVKDILEGLETPSKAPGRDEPMFDVRNQEALVIEVEELVHNKLFLDHDLDRARRQTNLLKLMTERIILPESMEARAQQALTRLTKQIAAHCVTEVASILNAAVNACRSDVSLSSQLNLVSIAISNDASEANNTNKEDAVDPDRLAHQIEMDIKCPVPVCEATVPLVHLRRAVCKNGHEFERCSVTLSLIGQVRTRTCVACSRTSLPDYRFGDVGASKANTEQGRQVIEAVLRASKWCLYCGGRWSATGKTIVRDLQAPAQVDD